VSLSSRKKIVSRLIASKEYRDAYVLEHIKNGIAFQIRALREDREWSQGKLGEMAQKPRNVISRLEDPNYGKFTLATLKFVPFSRLVEEYEDVSPTALSAKSVSDKKEIAALSTWAGQSTLTEYESTLYWQPITVIGDYTWSVPVAQDEHTAQGATVLHFPASPAATQVTAQTAEAVPEYLPGILYPKPKEVDRPARSKHQRAHPSTPTAATPTEAFAGTSAKYHNLAKQLAKAG
jgi:hypothetical protein